MNMSCQVLFSGCNRTGFDGQLLEDDLHYGMGQTRDRIVIRGCGRWYLDTSCMKPQANKTCETEFIAQKPGHCLVFQPWDDALMLKKQTMHLLKERQLIPIGRTKEPCLEHIVAVIGHRHGPVPLHFYKKPCTVRCRLKL